MNSSVGAPRPICLWASPQLETLLAPPRSLRWTAARASPTPATAIGVASPPALAPNAQAPPIAIAALIRNEFRLRNQRMPESYTRPRATLAGRLAIARKRRYTPIELGVTHLVCGYVWRSHPSTPSAVKRGDEAKFTCI